MGIYLKEIKKQILIRNRNNCLKFAAKRKPSPDHSEGFLFSQQNIKSQINSLVFSQE